MSEPANSPTYSPAAARRALAERDIEEVRRQEASGELDAETAKRLIRRYQEEIDRLDQDGDRDGERPTRNRSETARNRTEEKAAAKAPRFRRLTGTLLLIMVFIGVAVTAFYAVRSRDGGFITGDVGGPVDLSEVTNDQMEAVIAANPDLPEIAAMRLALADRYFEEGQFSSALPHYLGALEGALDRGRRARGMARVGWMSHLSGAGEVAEDYLIRAAEIDPGYLETRLFRGLVRFDRDDPAGALAHLEPLLAEEDLPGNIRQLIEETATEARKLLERAGLEGAESEGAG